MITYPSLESRLTLQEHRHIILEAQVKEISEGMTVRINQLSEDMKASFKQLADYQVKTEQQIDARFNQVESRLDKVEARLDKIETRLDNIETLLVQVLERLPKAS